MSFNKKRKKPNLKGNFSKNLRAMREFAITLTGNKKMRVVYDVKIPTSFINLEKSKIHMTLNSYPDWVAQHPLIAEKVLDGDLAHESGHETLTKPHSERFNNWVTKIKRNRGFFKLCHRIVNMVEDKRVNHFIIARFRHDFGKRLQLSNILMKDGIQEKLRTEGVQYDTKFGEAPLILGVMCGEGLYEANCKEYYDLMTPKAKQATKRILNILDSAKYKRTSLALVNTCQKLYDELKVFIPKGAEHKIYKFIPSKLGGKLELKDLSPELKNALEAQIKEEVKEQARKDAEELLKDLTKGGGAGEGTGEEIPTPEPNFEAYQALVDENKPEITNLLNRLKQLMRLTAKREAFQKRGRIMPAIISKAYVNSLRTQVKNVYLAIKSKYEREQVAIGFLFDYSGSVDRKDAQNITTILTEVFGNYVDDYGYAVACFGANSQKVKTFFETYENTKARIGNISVSASGTELAVLLRAFLRMFNNITPDRRKILVIASDFYLGDESESLELIKLYPRANIELIFIGFDNCDKVHTFASDLPKDSVRRTKIENVSELPDKFLDVYLNIQK